MVTVLLDDLSDLKSQQAQDYLAQKEADYQQTLASLPSALNAQAQAYVASKPDPFSQWRNDSGQVSTTPPGPADQADRANNSGLAGLTNSLIQQPAASTSTRSAPTGGFDAQAYLARKEQDYERTLASTSFTPTPASASGGPLDLTAGLAPAGAATTAPPTRDDWSLAGQKPNQYTVQPGDTLSGIAQRFGGDVGQIARASGISNPDLIQPGQRLTVGPSAAPSTGPGAPTAVQTPIGAGAGAIPGWLEDTIRNAAPDDLRSNPDFIRSVAAGAKAESNWDPRAVQPGGGGRGLFQFDVVGGMGRGLPDEQLYDPAYQAQQIVPAYAAAYRQGQQRGLSGAELASYAAGQAERPAGYDDPNSQARRGYAQAYQSISPSEQARDVTSGGYPGQRSVQPTGQDFINQVAPFLGSSYTWGGKNPQSGFDCSGLAGWLTTGQPESTGSLYAKSGAISQQDARPGDLVFWNMGSPDPHQQHTAVYIGDGRILQSGGSQANVNVGSVDQAIGSAPEFRRLGPGGVPAQAAPQQPGQSDKGTIGPTSPITVPFNAQDYLAQRDAQLAAVRNGGPQPTATVDATGGLTNLSPDYVQPAPVPAGPPQHGTGAEAIQGVNQQLADWTRRIPGVAGAEDALGNAAAAAGNTLGQISLGVSSEAGPAQTVGDVASRIPGAVQAAAPNPYHDIVEQGIPEVIQGVQQGDWGRAAVGALSMVGGVLSATPGAGGAGRAAAREAEPVTQAVLREVATNADSREVATVVRNAAHDTIDAAPAVADATATRAAAPALSATDFNAALIDEAEQRGVVPADRIAELRAQNDAIDPVAAQRRAASDNVANVTAGRGGGVQSAESAAPFADNPTTTLAQQADSLLRRVAPDLYSEQGLQQLTRGTPAAAAEHTRGPASLSELTQGVYGPTELAAGLTPQAVSHAAEPIGKAIASALSPTENLATPARQTLERYANIVGRQSDAANVIAENVLSRVDPAELNTPGLAPEITQQVRTALRNQATADMVAELQTQGLARIAGDAPSGWKLATTNPRSALANYAFDPRVVKSVRAVTDTSAIADNPVGAAILQATGTAKQTIFSLSNFHTITEGLNAAFSSPETLANYARAFVSDGFYEGLRGQMLDTFADAARNGVTGLAQRVGPDVEGQIANTVWRRVVSGGVSGVGSGAAAYTSTKAAGGSEDEARRNALIAAAGGAAVGGLPLTRGARTVPEMLQSSLWERAVPMAKATAWQGLVDGGLPKDVAAKVINERFGGLNYAAMGRDPTFMDATRLLVMAPDWNESTVRQLGSAIFGGNGQGVRAAFLAKTIAGMVAVTEAANYALSGHSTLQNQPGHQFEIEWRTPAGGYMHVGVLPGNIQAWLNLANRETVGTEAGTAAPLVKFASNRAAAVPQMLGEAAQTLTARTPQDLPYTVQKGGAVAGTLSRLAPIGISQSIEGVEHGLHPGMAMAMAAAGLNPKYSKAGGTKRSGSTATSGYGRATRGFTAPKH